MLVALFFFFRDGDRDGGRRSASSCRWTPSTRTRSSRRFYDTLTASVQSMVAERGRPGRARRPRLLADRRPDVQRLPRLRHRARLVPAAGRCRRSSGAGPASTCSLTGDDAARRSASRCGARWWSAWSTTSSARSSSAARANLPTFLLLFSILGGLKVYGFLGVFLGPVIARDAAVVRRHLPRAVRARRRRAPCRRVD